MHAPVIIGIPSYNEEQNIPHLLRSLEKQTLPISAVVISDDSTDNTPEIIKKFSQDSKLNIILLHHSVRRGAAAAWNEIFETASELVNHNAGVSSEANSALVLYDADVIPHGECTSQLASRIGTVRKSDFGRAVHVCASRPEPVQADTLAASASAFISNWLRYVRNGNGISKYTVMGRALAVSLETARRVRIPENLIAIDLFLQCRAIELGMSVEYNDDAVVYFRPARTLRDLASQVLRALEGHDQLKDHISRLQLDLPTVDELGAGIRAGSADPIGFLSAVIGYSFIPYYRSRFSHAKSSALWDVALSSKSIDIARFSETSQ